MANEIASQLMDDIILLCHCLWQWADQRFILGHLPAGIYLLKINNINNRARCEICSKLTIKTPE